LPYRTLKKNLKETLKNISLRRRDTQHNNIPHNDIQHNDIPHNDIQNNEIQHRNKLNVTFSLKTLSIIKGIVVLLSVIYAEYCKQTHYAESHYVKCRGAFFNAKAWIICRQIQECGTHFM
jgi:hypothetical protein